MRIVTALIVAGGLLAISAATSSATVTTPAQDSSTATTTPGEENPTDSNRSTGGNRGGGQRTDARGGGQHWDFVDPGSGEAGVVSRVSLAEGGQSQAVWTPPAWLRACQTRTVKVSQMTGDQSALLTFVNRRNTAAEHQTPDTEWVILHCPPPSASALRGGVVGLTSGVMSGWVSSGYPRGTTPPQFVIDWLIADALTKVKVPIQAGSSAPNGEDQIIYYQLQVVTWVDPAIWQPVSASSSLWSGGPTVTVTATPVSAVFEARPNEPGDAESYADCGDWATTPWSLALDDQLIAQGCHVTFKRAGDHHLHSEITWSLAWQCIPGCGSGNFGGRQLTRQNNRPVQVSEYQVVEVNPTP